MTPGSSSGNSSGLNLAPAASVGGGRFTLLRVLGHGGMGVVWLAQDQRLQEKVALKFLPREVGSDAIALDDMRRETQKSRRLTHPNIVRIHDLFEIPGEAPFIAMEFVDGPTMNALRFERAGRILSWEFLRPIVRQLCSALEHAHEEGVIHRDLKPTNIMLDARGRLKLADFGISAIVNDTVSRVSMRHPTSGTAAYMSPQQMEGRVPSVGDDIYSLGASLYELLTSRPPFYSGDVVYQVRNVAATPLEERLAQLGVGNDVPPDVSAMILACLAKEPEHRPPNARAVAEWIGLPATQKPDSALITTPVNDEPETESPLAPQRDEETDEATTAGRSRSRRALIAAATATAMVVLCAGAGWLLTRKHSQHSQPSRAGTDAAQPGESSEEAGFIQLFNGRDLTGWEGDPRLWNVQDGVITVAVATNGPYPYSDYLLICTNWSGEDFELRARAKLMGSTGSMVGSRMPGNLGVRYRATRQANGKYGGYEIDLAEMLIANGHIIEPENRLLLAEAGQSTLALPGSGRRGEVQLQRDLGMAAIFNAYKPLEWNDLTVIVRGNHVIHRVNGVVTAELDDRNEAARPRTGAVALNAWYRQRGAVIGQFKDIRVKPLGSGVAASSSVPTVAAKIDGASATSSAPLPPVEAGFTELYNGRDLTGWSGDPRFWSVESGVLTGRLGETNAKRTFLIWTNGTVKDFELRFSFLIPEANSGVGYRGRDFGRWEVWGYQYVITDQRAKGGEIGQLFEHGAQGNRPTLLPGRGHLGAVAKRVIVNANRNIVNVGATEQSALAIVQALRHDDWNEGVIIARADYLIHRLNGVTVTEVRDDDIGNRTLSGVLALQVSGQSAFTRFRSIRLRKL